MGEKENTSTTTTTKNPNESPISHLDQKAYIKSNESEISEEAEITTMLLNKKRSEKAGMFILTALFTLIV